MTSDAKLSPKSRNVPNLNKKIQLIENYDKTFTKRKVSLEELAGKDLWKTYEDSYKELLDAMAHTQEIMNKIKKRIN